MASVVEPKTFKYERLPNASIYIRLLEITSVDEKRDIKVHCQLTTWRKAYMPKYTAISYTWGDPQLLTVILVNGKRMQVRRNCEDVLRQPCRKKGGYFWIDAICINQTDNKEKSFQVASMSGVYRNADQVLACVGRHQNDSEFLFRRLHRHRRFWGHFSRDTGLRIGKRELYLWIMWRRQSTIARLLNALRMLLERSYFTRVWIYQELFFGQDIQVCCEERNVELSLLWGLYLAFDAPLLRVRPLLEAGIRSKAQSRLSNLSDMIRNIRDFQSEDPRDRLFGTFAMIKWGGIKPIQPDYGQDRFDLAIEVLERIGQTEPGTVLSFSHTLSIAQLLELLDQPSSRMTDEIQKRQAKRVDYPVDPTRKARETVSIWNAYWGRRLYLHDASWQIQSGYLADETPFLSIEQWSKGDLWNLRNTDVLLPQEVQPHDWLLIPSHLMTSNERALMAFIARDDCYGRVQLVDKALFAGWTDWSTASLWQDWGFMFDVRLDLEDAIVLAHTCNWVDWEEGLWLKDDHEAHNAQVDDYFGTRLQGDRNCSYAGMRVQWNPGGPPPPLHKRRTRA